jgi:hypothetical protein
MNPFSRTALVAALAAAALGGCTWVKMDPGAKRVRVIDAAADASACAHVGEIGVSVQHKVGLYRRGELKVRDELETLARNEAIGLNADAVQPLGEPANGEQRFAALRCGASRPSAPAATATPAQPSSPTPLTVEEVQTYPVKLD